MERYVIPNLESCVYATATFDLWMLKGTYDIFALVVDFLNAD